MTEAIRDLWFYALGFFIFMTAAPVAAFQYPKKDPEHAAMNGIAALCVFIGFVFLLMACAHAGKKAGEAVAARVVENWTPS